MSTPPLREALAHLDKLAATRDRERLAELVACGARSFLGAQFALLHRVSATPQGYAVAPAAWAVEGHSSITDMDRAEAAPLSADPLLEECLAHPEGFAFDEHADDVRLAFAVGELGASPAIFEARCEQMPAEEALGSLRSYLRIYEEHLKLLDYAELDTLTKLNNRKTFDENFDRFISIAEQARRAKDGDRREEEERFARPCWIGVVDIDKFKRINDNFGHLFGDEVLLRVAELMKKTFRTSDKLFRFGGEEFVVLLRHVAPDKATIVFDRFRAAVEHYDFPQVGKVTCSLGYMQIQPQLTPAEMLGRADEALYFCKENGRNQINCYEDLVAQGKLEGPQETSNTELQADIDALFG